MRLTKEQIFSIHQAIQNVLSSIPYQIFLFGSRKQDNLRGGDIDLALLVDKSDKPQVQNLDIYLLTQMKKQRSIGDRKIDLKIICSEDLETNPFIQKISADWVQI